MKTFYSILIATAISFSASTTYAINNFTAHILMTSKLVGEFVVPPVTTDAIGEASFSLNDTHDTLCISITVKGLSGPITAAHLQYGPIGGSGPLVLDLTPHITGNTILSMITSPDLNPTFVSRLIAGDYYISIKTASYPDGEIRGQISLESDDLFVALPDGMQQVPQVTTNAYGLFLFDLARHNVELKITGVLSGLGSPVTNVKLHTGAPGAVGTEMLDITWGMNGNILYATVNPDTFLIDLTYDNMYITVHTQANPAGEIRGQIIRQEGLTFDMYMNGNGMVPPVTTTGTAFGYMKANASMDSLWYNIVCDGLSSPLQGAKLFFGSPGVTGNQALDISSSINGKKVSGVVGGNGSISKEFINNALKGEVYIELSTATNPNGEVRSQLYRYLREGLTYIIDGAQEVPATASQALGSGNASIDRNMSNLHFRMVVNGLSGPVTAAHFHQAVPGFPGPPIFDLTPYFEASGTSDGAFNYWLGTNNFDATVAQLFMTDQVYVNVHTSAFPDGEIRGDIHEGAVCSNLSTGIADVLADYGVSVYPNPVSDAPVTVSFNGIASGNALITLLDLRGRVLRNESVFVGGAGQNIEVPMYNTEAGLYMLRIQMDNRQPVTLPITKY